VSAAPVRDAATVILYRRPEAPEVLMGRRGARAAFMPGKFVFPGGAVDPGDAEVPLTNLPCGRCMARLAEEAPPGRARALVAAAIRELWEETGLALGRPGHWPDAPPDWTGFAARGLVPDGVGLTFVFRAITPPGRPRRFDARFFLAPAAAVAGDAEDFAAADAELAELQWIPLAEVRRLDLPFITEVALAEVGALLARGTLPPPDVPFFRNDDEASLFLRLRGATPGADQ